MVAFQVYGLCALSISPPLTMYARGWYRECATYHRRGRVISGNLEEHNWHYYLTLGAHPNYMSLALRVLVALNECGT